MTAAALDIASLAPSLLASAEDTRPLSALNTEELMERYVDGDVRAFDHLYRAVSPRLFAMLLRMSRSRTEAEDLLQATFTKVHRARESYLRGTPVLPWLVVIARRVFFDQVRARGRRGDTLSRDGVLPEGSTMGTAGAVETTQALERALEELPEAYREAIVLPKITGLSVAEAAEVVGTTPTSIKIRVHRGNKRLRELLDIAA